MTDGDPNLVTDVRASSAPVLSPGYLFLGSQCIIAIGNLKM